MDERTRELRNKIGNEAFIIIYYAVIISFLIKVLFFGKGMEDCIVEYGIIIFVPIYYFIRTRQLEVSLFGNGNKTRNKTIVTSIVLLLAAAIYTWQMVASGKAEVVSFKGITNIIVFIVVFSFGRYLLYTIEKKRKDKLESKYDEE